MHIRSKTRSDPDVVHSRMQCASAIPDADYTPIRILQLFLLFLRLFSRNEVAAAVLILGFYILEKAFPYLK